MTRYLGSCKYGAECGRTVACECDCCLEDHECECDGIDDYQAGLDDEPSDSEGERGNRG